MAKRNITTSVQDGIYRLAQEKNIKWSEALRVGILKIAGVEFVPESDVFYEKTTEKHIIDKLQHANSKMQEIIQQLNEKIEAGGKKDGNF